MDFKCAGCGRCCMSHGYVYLTTRDRVVLSSRFGMTVAEFTQRYCTQNKAEYHLNNPEDDCIFLCDKRCSVYEDRPEQCRAWPYWTENFINGKLKVTVGSYCKALNEIRGERNT